MRISGIDANLLMALDALLQEKSVTRAAQKLGVGQPAMSHSLARLREHFKDALLIPRGRELVLSARAEQMASSVASAAAAFARLFEQRPNFDPHASRTFVLACSDLFALRFVPAIQGALAREASGARLEVRTLAARSSTEILGNGVDLAFGVFADVPSALNQQQLFQDPFVCVVRADHPIAGEALSLQTYLELPHLEVAPARDARPSERIDRLLAARGEQRLVTTRVPYFMLAAQLVAQSDCILTMTAASAQVLCKGAPLRIVACPLALPPLAFSQIWDRRHDSDPAHRWLRELAGRICRPDAEPLPTTTA